MQRAGRLLAGYRCSSDRDCHAAQGERADRAEHRRVGQDRRIRLRWDAHQLQNRLGHRVIEAEVHVLIHRQGPEVINSYRSIGAVQVGDIVYTYKGVGPVVEAGGVTSVEVRVCGDASNSDMVDANGESVLEADRPRFIDYRLDVVMVGNSWRVNGGPSEAVESC